MKINEFINESTTAGSIATVAAPMTTQKRNNIGKGVYGNEKPGTLLTGKKTNKKYANSVNESKMKQVAMDLEHMQDGNFKQKYGKSKDQIKFLLGDPKSNKTVHEATLEEDDVILVPGQGHRLKTGFHAFDPDKAEHEGETLKNSLRTIARNAKELHNRLENHDQFPEWVSEKIGQIKGMITSVTEYLISHQEGDAAPEHEGVIAGGGVGESLANWNMGIQSIPRTSEWKRKAITAISPGPWPKEYTFDTEQEAIQHFTKAGWEKIKAGVPTKSGKPWQVIYADDVTEGVKEKIKGVIRREKSKDMPLVQTRRDYAMMKALDSYEKGNLRKGNQYNAWAERDRKKQGAPTTNPAGTYRTKTSDYTNEGKYGKGMRDCCDSPAQKNQPHVKGCKSYSPTERDRRDDMERHNRETIPGYKSRVPEAQSMGTALKNSLAKAEPGSKLDNSIKAHNRNIKAGQAGTLKNAPEGYHFDKKGYCRLGDK
jgi:hypothetical protein